MFIISIFLSLLFISGGIYSLFTEYFVVGIVLIIVGIFIFVYAVYQRNKYRKNKPDDSCVGDICGELSCHSLGSGFNKLDCGCGDGGSGGCDCSP